MILREATVSGNRGKKEPSEVEKGGDDGEFGEKHPQSARPEKREG